MEILIGLLTSLLQSGNFTLNDHSTIDIQILISEYDQKIDILLHPNRYFKEVVIDEESDNPTTVPTLSNTNNIQPGKETNFPKPTTQLCRWVETNDVMDNSSIFDD